MVASMLSKIKTFLSELDLTPKHVYVSGYSNEYYKVNYKGKEWYIERDQSIFNKFKKKELSPDDLPDLSFYKAVFTKQIKDFKAVSKKHTLSVNKHIMRKWYYNPSTFKSLALCSEIQLYASPSPSNTEFWEIGNDFGFKRSSGQSDDAKSKVNIEYSRQEIISLYMYLTVYDDYLPERVAGRDLSFQYTSFYILELSEKELILQIAY